MANAKNYFQGETKKVLCVCSAGLLRSPTAAHLLNREFGYNTRAVGHAEEYALIHIDAVHLNWADEVVCLDKDIFEALNDRFGSDPLWEGVDVSVLAVPDMFVYGDEDLEALILKQYKETQDE
jgi:predicted protein tyrosine phosphatase